jgi:MFS family permease
MKKGLYSKEFIVFNIVFFLAFINMAVFFHLHQYLRSISIDERWSGLVIGVFSFAAVFLQPILSPFVHVRNARPFLITGLLITIVSLFSYRWMTTPWSLLAIRLIHGAGFITFVTAMNASIVAMIPAAALPALIKPGRNLQEEKTTVSRTGVFRGIGNAFRHPIIAVLLVTNILVFLSYTPVFFLLKEYAQGKGIGKPGVFFTVSTGTMISIRLLGGRIFDRLNKKWMMILSLLLLSVAYTLLAWTRPGIYLILGFIFGLGWSLYAPLLNSLLFEFSLPDSRGLSLNLSMVMLQTGYLIGPTIGTFLLAEVGYSGLFIYCGLLPFLGACLVFFFIRKGKARKTL